MFSHQPNPRRLFLTTERKSIDLRLRVQVDEVKITLNNSKVRPFSLKSSLTEPEYIDPNRVNHIAVNFYVNILFRLIPDKTAHLLDQLLSTSNDSPLAKWPPQ